MKDPSENDQLGAPGIALDEFVGTLPVEVGEKVVRADFDNIFDVACLPDSYLASELGFRAVSLRKLHRFAAELLQHAIKERNQQVLDAAPRTLLRFPAQVSTVIDHDGIESVVELFEMRDDDLVKSYGMGVGHIVHMRKTCADLYSATIISQTKGDAPHPRWWGGASIVMRPTHDPPATTLSSDRIPAVTSRNGVPQQPVQRESAATVTEHSESEKTTPASPPAVSSSVIGAVDAATKLREAYDKAVEDPFLAAMKVMQACDAAAAESPLRVAEILIIAIGERPSAPAAFTETMANVVHSYLLMYSASPAAALVVDGEFRQKLLSRIEAILRVSQANEEKQPTSHLQFYLHVSKEVLLAMEGTQNWSKTTATFGCDVIKAVASFSLSGLAGAVAKPLAALLKAKYLAYKRENAKSSISAVLEIAMLHAAGALAMDESDVETAQGTVRALRELATAHVKAGEWLPVYAAVTAIGAVADSSSAVEILTSKGGAVFSIADAADFYRSLTWPRNGWRVRAAAYRAQLEMLDHLSKSWERGARAGNCDLVTLVATEVARATNAETDGRARLAIDYREWIGLRAKIANAGPVLDPTVQLCEAVRGAVADVWDTSAVTRIGDDINSVKEELQRMAVVNSADGQDRAAELREVLARLETEALTTQERLREEAAALGKSAASVDAAVGRMNEAAQRISVEAEKMQEACADVVARLAANQDLTQSERLQQLGTAVALDFQEFRAEEALVPLRGRDVEELNNSTSFDLAERCAKFLDDDTAQVLVMLAGSGSGKSTFLRWRQAELWSDYLQQRNETTTGAPWVALRFELANCSTTTTREELARLIEDDNGLPPGGLENLVLSGDKPTAADPSGAACRVVLLLDAFDELPRKFSLATALRLGSYKVTQLKVIVTSRTEHVDVDSDAAYFTPMRSKKLLRERVQRTYVNPFGTEQISCFVKLHVSHLAMSAQEDVHSEGHGDRDDGALLSHSVSFATRGQPREAEWYEAAITSSPALLGMSSNPFVLKLIVEVLPALLDSERAPSDVHLNEVYAAFAGQWFEWQANRLAQNGAAMDVCASVESFKAFSHSLATRMILSGLKVVNSTHEPWKSEVFTEPLVQCGAPLRRTGKGKFEFLHASLMQYFAATVDDVLPLLRRILFSYADKTEIDFLADRAKHDEWFSDVLMGFITASAGRTDLSSPEAVTASNAMTVLVAAKRCFSCVSFAGALLPSAILSGGHFHHCDFSGCNLTGAFINNTNVVHSDFSNAVLDDARIGFNVLRGHTSAVLSVAVSKDGSRIVSGSEDKTVRLWDAMTGDLVQTLEGHTRRVSSVGFSPDGSRIVSGAWDKTVRLWDVETGKNLQTLEGHIHPVYSVAFRHDGTHIVSGSQDKTVRVWDAVTGKNLQTLEGHTDPVNCVAFSHDGTHIVSGSTDTTVRVWDATTGKHLQTLEGHTLKVSSVAVTQDGSRIVSGSSDKTVRVWDAAAGKELHILEGHPLRVQSVAVSDDGSRIVSGSNDKTVRLWNATSGKLLQTLEGHTEHVASVAVSRDGSRIVSASHDQTLRVWDAATSKYNISLEGHIDHGSSVAFSPDGSRIFSGAYDATIRAWDPATGKHLQTLEGHTDGVWALVVSSDSSRIVSGCYDKTIGVWDATSGKLLQTLEGHTAIVSSVAVSHDGSRIVSGSNDRTVRLWDAATGSPIHILKGHTGSLGSVDFSPDGSRIVSCSRDKTLRVWDAETGEHLQTFEGHTDSVSSVVVTQDGSRIVSGAWDQTGRVWDATSGKLLQTLEGHTEWVTSVAVSQDGSRIVSGSWDQTVRVWDATSGKLLQTLEGHTALVSSVAISPNGMRILSTSRDRSVRVWDFVGEKNCDVEDADDRCSSFFVQSHCLSATPGNFFWRHVRDKDGPHRNCLL